MLSLKDFKKYEVMESSLQTLKGGISCWMASNIIQNLLDSSDPQQNEQGEAIVNWMIGGGQLQCTSITGELSYLSPY